MTRSCSTAKQARRRLRELAEPGRAGKQAWFFKAMPGGYGEGDRFHGDRVPDVRRVARECHDLDPAEIHALLVSPFHEERLLALFLLVRRFEKGDAATREAVVATYLDNLDHVNNWDLVDASASRILGAHLIERDRSILHELSRSPVLWERRVAIIATFAFIRNDDYADTLEIARRLLNDEEDLIHKGTGWMLREVGKRDAAVLESFLDGHCSEMPRTMLRYAIERLDPDRRALYMGKPPSRKRRRLRPRGERS